LFTFIFGTIVIGTNGSTIGIGTFIFGTIVIGTSGNTIVIGIIVSTRNRILSYYLREVVLVH
jgi:hypothetical protein